MIFWLLIFIYFANISDCVAVVVVGRNSLLIYLRNVQINTLYAAVNGRINCCQKLLLLPFLDVCLFIIRPSWLAVAVAIVVALDIVVVVAVVVAVPKKTGVWPARAARPKQFRRRRRRRRSPPNVSCISAPNYR